MVLQRINLLRHHIDAAGELKEAVRLTLTKVWRTWVWQGFLSPPHHQCIWWCLGVGVSSVSGGQTVQTWSVRQNKECGLQFHCIEKCIFNWFVIVRLLIQVCLSQGNKSGYNSIAWSEWVEVTKFPSAQRSPAWWPQQAHVTRQKHLCAPVQCMFSPHPHFFQWSQTQKQSLPRQSTVGRHPKLQASIKLI